MMPLQDGDVPITFANIGDLEKEFGFSPHLEQSESFSANLSCRPCSKHGSKDCRFKNKKCFLIQH